MKHLEVDLMIVGGGPVGLLASYLADQRGLSSVVVDKKPGPIEAGRADALNARTLQLFQIAGLFNEVHPLGKPCNTSSIWKDGQFIERRSDWWEELEGCAHKHFLMLGQAYIEQLLDKKVQASNSSLLRNRSVESMTIEPKLCLTTLDDGTLVESKYVIGCDGSRSWVRENANIAFEIVRPEITWAVIDAEFETDFPKAPEIIVFQNESSDVAWIPREDPIDRFYVRMDRKDFSLEEAFAKVQKSILPHQIEIKKLHWFSQFSVKESVAESFRSQGRVFLAGDASHIHSVNGGQGLNTGLADAFNLIWKISEVLEGRAEDSLLDTYQSERKPVAESVIASSGELVRSTKFSESGTHAQDYIDIVEKRSGNITGMGIRYEGEGLRGRRMHDVSGAFYVSLGKTETSAGGAETNGSAGRLYEQLSYGQHALIMLDDAILPSEPPKHFNVLRLHSSELGLSDQLEIQGDNPNAKSLAILVRPDGYIADYGAVEDVIGTQAAGKASA